MERRRFRYLVPLALLIIMLGMAYRSNSALAEPAHPLVADSWNSAFYSSLSVADQPADMEMPPVGYPDDLRNISGNSTISKTESGFPGGIVIMTGYPNPTVPMSGGNEPPPVVSGFPYPPISITGNPGTVTGFPKPPISVTGNPVSTCRKPVSITAVGFPYGPVTIKWSAVTGASSYWVGIGAIPPQKNYYVLLSYTNVAAPKTQAVITLNHAEAAAVVQHGSPYVVLVEPKTKDSNGCITAKQYSTAVRKTTLATKPATLPATPPAQTGSGDTFIPTATPIIELCPVGQIGDPANGHPCQPVGGVATKAATPPATQPANPPATCPKGQVLNPLTGGCSEPVRTRPTPCPPGTQGNPGGPCIDIPK